MAKKTALNLKDLISRQRELVAAGDSNAAKQLARLEELAGETKAQTAILEDIRKSQPTPNPTDEAGARTLEDMTRKGMLDKTGDGLNANIIKLLKSVKTSTKGMSPTSTGPEFTSPGPVPVTPSRSDSVAARVADQGKRGKMGAIGYAKQEFKKLGTLGGWFDTSNSKGQGLIGQAVMRAQEKGDFVKDQLATGATTNKGLAAKRFDKVNDLRLEGGRLLEETQAMRGRGLSEDQIARTGVFNKQKATDDKIAIANPLYRENRLAEQNSQVPRRPTTGSPVTGAEAPTLGVPMSAGGTSEQASENLRMMADQNETLKQIEENTRVMAGLVGVSKTPPPAQPQPEGSRGILGDVGDMFGGKGAGGILRKGGALLGRAGTGILTAGKAVASAASPLLSQAGGLATRAIAGAGGVGGIAAAAAPAAIMYGAANAVDYGLGKLGVGKDAEGNDLQVDKEQDDANWKKMTWSQKLQSGVARGIEKVGGFVGLGNLSQEAAAGRVKSETEYFAKSGGGVESEGGTKTLEEFAMIHAKQYGRSKPDIDDMTAAQQDFDDQQAAQSGPLKKAGPNWTASLKGYKSGTPVDYLEKKYPGISAKFLELAKANPPRGDDLQDISVHEKRLEAMSLKALTKGEAAPNAKPAENDNVKAMQAERDAFAEKGPATDSAQSRKAHEKVLAAKDKAIESEKQKVSSPPREARKRTDERNKWANDPNRATPSSAGEQRKEGGGLESQGDRLRAEAIKLGIDPNKAEGTFEGGQLTGITDSATGKSYPIAVDPSKQRSVDAARSMRAMNENSANLATAAAAPAPRDADNVYNKSGENAAKSLLTAQVPGAPVVINAPTNVSNTSNMAVKSPIRNTESSYRSYERSKFAAI